MEKLKKKSHQLNHFVFQYQAMKAMSGVTEDTPCTMRRFALFPDATVTSAS